MTNNNHSHHSLSDSSVASPVWQQPQSEHGFWDLRVVAMDKRETQTQEANYLFFVASVGMALNLLVIIMIGFRRSLRKMTSAFLIHSGFLNFLKAAFCIAFGLNLLSSADDSKGNQPADCVLQGSGYIVYQAFSFIAWTEAMVEPIILICFDRNINILARFLYCDRDHYTATQIAFLLSHNQHPDMGLDDHPDITSLQNSTHAEHAFHRADGQSPDSVLMGSSTIIPCCQCSSLPLVETTPLRPSAHHRPSSEMYDTRAAQSSTQELRAVFEDYVPQIGDHTDQEISYTGQEMSHIGQEMPYHRQEVPYNRHEVPYNGEEMSYNGQEMSYNIQEMSYKGHEKSYTPESVQLDLRHQAALEDQDVREDDVQC
ncbi:unnamed protein product [Candidula unifasciata]|uniref:Uncharacterized protein n=1 Tax=Candidula unifasciata TaxID=100452 RepID=A0A8S3ZL15_9EUPU|nr:unnamed protein product [Candidula unifasciata]